MFIFVDFILVALIAILTAYVHYLHVRFKEKADVVDGMVSKTITNLTEAVNDQVKNNLIVNEHAKLISRFRAFQYAAIQRIHKPNARTAATLVSLDIRIGQLEYCNFPVDHHTDLSEFFRDTSFSKAAYEVISILGSNVTELCRTDPELCSEVRMFVLPSIELPSSSSAEFHNVGKKLTILKQYRSYLNPENFIKGLLKTIDS